MMSYRRIPGTGDSLSALGFGMMRLPTSFGGRNSAAIDKEAATALVRRAVERGINYFDTAYFYHLGASETFLGEAIRTLRSEGVTAPIYIADKLPTMLIHSRKQMDEIFEKQCSRLGVETIDYYLLHALDGVTWKKMLDLGVIDFLDQLKKNRRVRSIGFSFHGKKQDFYEIADGYDFDFAQVQYNILDVQFQAGIEGIEYCAEKGMGVIIMEPLRGGTLTTHLPPSVEKIYKESAILRSPAEWALRFVLDHPAVTVVLSGMNVMEHLEENCRVASDALPHSLTPPETAIIDRVREEYASLLRVGCTGCSYCIPCPAKINIPQAFKNLNNAAIFSKTAAKMDHAIFLGAKTPDGKAHFTTDCIDCGKCEEKCPQGIPIRQVFHEVRRELEGSFTKSAAFVIRQMLRLKKKKPDA